MDPILIFANRSAGAQARVRGTGVLEQYAREAGLEPEVRFTRSPRHLRELLRQEVIGRRDRVVVAGGDGTVRAAVQELAGTDVALGILPQGTANNFAGALRLPLDLPSAFRVIADGETQQVGLGVANGEYFTEAAGVGVFAELLGLTGAEHHPRAAFRALRYLVSWVVTNQPLTLRLTLDGVTEEVEALSVTIANSFLLGYRIPIAPNARLTDDVLDVVIIGPLLRRELLPYFRAVRTQTHGNLPKIRTVQARRIEVVTRRPIPIHIDDHTSGQTPLVVHTAPRCLKVLVDRL